MLPRVPFISFVLFFSTGILLGKYVMPTGLWSLALVSALTGVFALIAVWFYFRRQAFTGYCIALFFVLAGTSSFLLHSQKRQYDLESVDMRQCDAYVAIVKSLPEKRTKSLRLEIILTKIRVLGKWENLKAAALVSIPLDAGVVPQAGDLLVVAGTPERPPAPLNPREFDYRGYLWNRGIVWTDYLQEGSYQVIKDENKSPFAGRWDIVVSQWADGKFRKHIQNDPAYGLVKAMLLGRRDDLRTDQVNDYIISGTIHILSVSGMHVAILFLVLSKILGWLKRLKGGRFLYLAVLIGLLCFYALVTGLAPSVLRATWMCIVVIIAETFGRKQFSMNTLGISALLILAIDPYALFDLGFQLSFLAMTGIFLFYQPMETLWNPDHFVLRNCWQVTALSFAAQLATFPLSLYYFHQFPFYFWLVNPFVIFFTNILLPAAMCLLAVSAIPVSWLQSVVSAVVEWSAYLTDLSVGVPKFLPGYLIHNLYLDVLEVVLLYLFMFGLWYAHHSRRFSVFRYTSLLGLIFVFYSLSQSVQDFYTSQVMVHAVPRHAVISMKEGNQLFVISDSLFPFDADAYNFRIKNYAINQGVLETVYLSGKPKFKGHGFVVHAWKDGEVLAWKGKLLSRGAPVTFNPDYMVISTGYPPAFNPDSTHTLFMLGGEVRGRNARKWEEYLTLNNHRIYDLNLGAISLP